VIDPLHFVPVVGYLKAAKDMTEMYEDGEITAFQYYGYMSSLATINSLHVIHTAAHNQSGFGLAAVRKLQMIPTIAIASIPITLAGANMAVIEAAPEEQQKGLWQMFSSGLTGTFGIGSGLNL
jgi:hypothetical protein